MNKAIKVIFLFITINLIIAALILIYIISGLRGITFSGLRGLRDLIFEMPLNLGVGIFGLYFSGFFIGKKMNALINTKRWNSIIVGVIGLILILLIGIFFGSTVGFLQEGLNNIDQEGALADSLFDYYFKPFIWILLFGIIPTIIAGGIMGWKIKNVQQHRL